jgi:Cof subfamily protein (haloacid dehalogenase superfamily)
LELNLTQKQIWFVTDMDGTFLPESKIPLDMDMTAVRRFKDGGGKFAFATGRIFQASKRYLDLNIANAPCILANGSMIYDPVSAKVLYRENLSREALETAAYIYKHFPDISVEINTPDEVLVCRSNAQEMNHINLVGFTNWRETTIAETVKYDLTKILFAGEEPDVDKLEAYFKANPIHSGEFVRSSKHFYEIIPSGCSKGSALQKLREMMGPNAYFIAMGDYYNDLEMLQNADFAACPSNAEPFVKHICDYVCRRSVEQGAAAEVFELLASGKIA